MRVYSFVLYILYVVVIFVLCNVFSVENKKMMRLFNQQYQQQNTKPNQVIKHIEHAIVMALTFTTIGKALWRLKEPGSMRTVATAQDTHRGKMRQLRRSRGSG
jgi:uncharacterized membrane protein YkvI